MDAILVGLTVFLVVLAITVLALAEMLKQYIAKSARADGIRWWGLSLTFTIGVMAFAVGALATQGVDVKGVVALSFLTAMIFVVAICWFAKWRPVLAECKREEAHRLKSDNWHNIL